MYIYYTYFKYLLIYVYNPRYNYTWMIIILYVYIGIESLGGSLAGSELSQDI
jgi:hypothetical protein